MIQALRAGRTGLPARTTDTMRSHRSVGRQPAVGLAGGTRGLLRDRKPELTFCRQNHPMQFRFADYFFRGIGKLLTS